MWLLVANPSARSGLAGADVDAALDALRAHGVPVELRATLPGGATVHDVAAALREGAYVGVVAMGGDGTFHEVANGLLASGCAVPLGLIPAGTGNNQARSLGLPLGDLDAAAARIAAVHTGAARPTPMDGARVTAWDALGAQVGAAWCFDSVGFGFSARTLLFRFEDKAEVEQVPFLRDLWRDELVYIGAVVRALVGTYLEDHRFGARVTTEHGVMVFENLHDLVINNSRYYARAWVLDPSSRHDDGVMELLPIHGMDEWAALALVDYEGSPLRNWFDGGPAAGLLRAARFDIELLEGTPSPPIPTQVDGEPWPPVRRVRIEVEHGVLMVIAGE